MNQKTKKGVENSLNQLFNEVRRTKSQNDYILKTTYNFIDLAKDEKMSEVKFIGSVPSNLSINYKDKGFDVDAMLIWNNISKEQLVDIKFQMIEIFQEYGKQNYQKVKVHNKKPVVSIRFLSKDGNDKFHIDFVFATKDGNDTKFVYSDKPSNKDNYDLIKNESVEMLEHFKNIVNKNSDVQKSIVLLKWWNDNKTKNLTKNTKLPSSLINEIVIKKSDSSVVDLMISSLEEMHSIIKAKKDENEPFCSDFEPKWDYLRKMNDEQLNQSENLIESSIDAFEKSLNNNSIEEAISILKKFFDQLKVVIDEDSEAGANDGRAG